MSASAPAAGALAVLLGGCGTEEDGGAGGATTAAKLTPVQAVEAAADAARKKGTARFTHQMEIGLFGGSAKATGEGEVDLTKPAMSMTATMKAKGEKTQTVAMVLIGDTYYQKPSGEKRWIKEPAGGPGELAVNLSQEGGDPTGTLTMLQDVSDVKEAGRETVNGVETAKYAGLFNGAEAGAQGVGDGAEASPGASTDPDASASAGAGPEKIPFELYVDGDGLPVRIFTDASEEPDPEYPELGGSVFKVTQDFTDWGTPVTIKPPKGAVSGEKSGGTG